MQLNGSLDWSRTFSHYRQSKLYDGKVNNESFAWFILTHDIVII